ncbi:hypothetical protein P678_2675 [Acinetobacter baumannii UH7807]|uniref:Uncharacterized protein n=1 Tax=Acinetobacter baumannii UH5307 TaxID=1398973 RepID=A0ABC9V077_ACIBA|nr:hypothetical protein AYP_003298 [Acinetobacter baumannii]ETP82042.1 hypothetical protein P642_3922 [Acinetobacter baumannii UH1007]ETP92727.1 hypothetical protein P644_2928 [Acinetobacter baumannii UH10107]ETQ23437.1 hypothetical protein P652_2484 [Acinetobacter baumannii UH14508]ETQ36878.1 hypothetical protein P654_2660 [Acinetobacter baumannii UH16008]ETQ44272.1 hypothetical protein P655_3217 [Acinetobacter baumannii UH16108]ETQ50517.1 hypothetical protein P659_0696 [Acinetobacter bauman
MLERLELASMKRLIPANAKYAPNEKAPHVGACFGISSERRLCSLPWAWAVDLKVLTLMVEIPFL